MLDLTICEAMSPLWYVTLFDGLKSAAADDACTVRPPTKV